MKYIEIDMMIANESYLIPSKAHCFKLGLGLTVSFNWTAMVVMIEKPTGIHYFIAPTNS